MLILVNAKPQELPAGATVQQLLERLKLLNQRVAIEVNTELVTKSEWAARVLKDGDKVEIVTFVGGG